MASHSETGQSLRKVYHFTRTLNELGPLPRVLFRTAREITNRNFTVFMHWGIIIDDRIFELSGNSKSIDHRFVTNPLTAEEEATHQSKEYRGWTALSDARILEIGQEIADENGEPYDVLRRNCQDLIDRLLRRILVEDALVVPKYKQTLNQRFGDIIDLLPSHGDQRAIGVIMGRFIHSS